MGKFVDRTGQVFGRLTVIKRAEVRTKNGAVWECKCECGKTVNVLAYNLANGNSKSCGCFSRERTRKHGFCSSSVIDESGTYHVWEALKQRTTKPNCKAYKNYGGRGIKIDPRWENFENFLLDMGVRPHGTSLDRIDNNGDYTPENCKWSTRIEQNSNKRDNFFIEYKGEKMTISELSRRTGVGISRLRHRIVVQGLTVDESLTRPVTMGARNRGQSK